jgi:exosortase/archaeosortase family protein
VPTDMRRSTDARSFVLRAVVGSLGLFGLLRLSAIETQLVLPITQWQGALAARWLGAPAAPVEVTLACSGADALALCAGAILAYPVAWRMRLAGAATGVVLILGLNTMRIGSLGLVVGSPFWFNVLHLYAWPSLLTLAIAGYVFAWIQIADRRDALSASRTPVVDTHPQPSRQFMVASLAFLLVFSLTSPIYLESPQVLSVAGVIARAAAAILGAIGIAAHTTGNVLWTARGGFLVTQECISTPLIPIFLAAVVTYSSTGWRMALGVLAAVPIFAGLGVLRLLVVALPEAVASPLFLVHAFYQLLLGLVAVCAAALWRHGGRAAAGYAIAGVTVGILFVLVLGPIYNSAITYYVGAPRDDPQGALALLPPFQVGLFLAIWLAAFVAAGWRTLAAGLALLGLTQTAGLFALQVLSSGAGITAQIRDIRAWAVAGPLLIALAVAHAQRARR